MAITLPRAQHADESNRSCRLIPISLAGNLTADNIFVTSTSIEVQVVTSAEISAPLIGTDEKNDGGGASDRGKLTGNNIPDIANHLDGTFTSSSEGIFNLADAIALTAAEAARTALKITGNCHFRQILRSGPIVPALKNRT